MMLHAPSPPRGQAVRFFLAFCYAFSYNFMQQYPPRISTMRTRGITSGILTAAATTAKIHPNTPAMPLHDAHFGGFFVSGVCR